MASPGLFAARELSAWADGFRDSSGRVCERFMLQVGYSLVRD
jgi:hypothetical protein